MRIIRFVLLLGLLSVSLHGTGWAQGAPAAPSQVITLGNSAAAPTGPRKFTPGDSPWLETSPVWAQPGFSYRSGCYAWYRKLLDKSPTIIQKCAA